MNKTVTAVALVALATTMNSVAAEKYTPDIQKTIPMDVANPTSKLLTTRRADLQGDREPGLINVQR